MPPPLVDVYGETLTDAEIVALKKNGGEETAAAHAAAMAAAAAAAVAAAQQKEKAVAVDKGGGVVPAAPSAPEVPMKTVTAAMSLMVRCQVELCDFSSRCDVRSAAAVLASLAPRKCAVVGGSYLATAVALGEELQREVGSGEEDCSILVPTPLESIKVSAGGGSLLLSLDAEVLRSAHFSVLGECRVAFVEGTLGGKGEDGVWSLGPNTGPSVRRGGSVFVGTLALPDVKVALDRAGVKATFKDGRLVCGAGGRVVVRREGKGERFVVEGGLCREYFVVRDLLYGSFSII